MKFYLLIQREAGIATHGPFETTSERSEFAAALWFGLPAREPYAQRGTRLPFNANVDRLWQTAVQGDRLYAITPIRVKDITAAPSFERFAAIAKKSATGREQKLALEIEANEKGDQS